MKKLSTEEINKLCIDAIDSIRPFINSDGGDIFFIKYEDDYLFIKLTGACVGCSMIDYTIEDGIYEAIKESIPDCKGVINESI